MLIWIFRAVDHVIDLLYQRERSQALSYWREMSKLTFLKLQFRICEVQPRLVGHYSEVIARGFSNPAFPR